MEILAARTILIPIDPAVTTSFYRDVVGLATARDYPGGTVFFAGNGLIEIAGHMQREPDSDTDAASIDATATPGGDAVLWLQVRDIADAARTLGDAVVREARHEPWGLVEMHAIDPDGRRLIFVEIPPEHPLRRDVRGD